MLGKSHYLILALGAGGALAMQVALNSRLRGAIGQPIQATFVSLAVGALGALAWCLMARLPWPETSTLAAVPLIAWCGGLLGVFYLWGTVVATPHVGTAVTFALIIAGQICISLAIDHFGWLGATVHPLNLFRAIGAILVLVGASVLAAFR
jgi:transporter family-2 protein